MIASEGPQPSGVPGPDLDFLFSSAEENGVFGFLSLHDSTELTRAGPFL